MQDHCKFQGLIKFQCIHRECSQRVISSIIRHFCRHRKANLSFMVSTLALVQMLVFLEDLLVLTLPSLVAAQVNRH